MNVVPILLNPDRDRWYPSLVAGMELDVRQRVAWALGLARRMGLESDRVKPEDPFMRTIFALPAAPRGTARLFFTVQGVSGVAVVDVVMIDAHDGWRDEARASIEKPGRLGGGGDVEDLDLPGVVDGLTGVRMEVDQQGKVHAVLILAGRVGDNVILLRGEAMDFAVFPALQEESRRLFLAIRRDTREETVDLNYPTNW